MNALMGAGTPENSQGDKAISEDGIVQGHAYAVLRCVEYEGDKLIQLRNPHGVGANTAEWRGDWSDSDLKWNQKAMNQIGYKPDAHPDGIFWMNIEDFVWEFKYLYICRVLDQSQGWNSLNLTGEWKGPSAAGFNKLQK